VTSRPRLLFVSPRSLFPMDEGGKIRTANILRHLKGGAYEVTLVAPASIDGARGDAPTELICDRFVSWAARPASQPRKLMALAAPIPVSVATDRSSEGRAAITRAIEALEPDIVLADFTHSAVLLPERIQTATVMFTHNVEAEIFERHAAQTAGVRGLVWRDQARKMRRFEADVLGRFDTVIAVSARDAKELQRRYRLPTVETIDTGVDLDYFARLPAPSHVKPNTIVFTGVMDSPANIDGINFLMQDVWPLISRARPDVRALIVGRNPSPAVIEAAREKRLPWIFTGSVPDIRPHVAEADVAVIPLRIGSGTRIKAFEAMAMGRPVVATTVGVEGLDITPGRHFLAADDPATFASAIVRLLEDPDLRETLVTEARGRLEERFSWATIARQFEAICHRTGRQAVISGG
jgi:glycosyltransferase involved in cell wall biosynthesis